MCDIPSGWAVICGGLIGLCGSCIAARWAFLAATSSVARKDRIAKIETSLAELIALLQPLAFSCRHSHKQPEEEIEIYEKARARQSFLLILIDPTMQGGNELINSMEAAFGMLKKDPMPSKEEIAFGIAAILAHGKTIINEEHKKLRKGK